MPRGVSTPWKIDPATGAVLPYYEGSFNVRGDLGNNSLGIDSEQVSAAQRTIDLYQPERLIFKRQALGDAGGSTAPGDEVGAIWAQYPDPLAIPADMNADASYSRVMVAAGAPGIGGRRGAVRKLLDTAGGSDFAFDTPWQNVSFGTTGGWGSVAGFPVQVKRISDYCVMRGLLTNTVGIANNTTMIGLPSNCLMADSGVRFPVWGWDAGAAAFRMVYVINSGTNVLVWTNNYSPVAAHGGGAGSWVPCSMFSWKAAP